VPERAAEPQTEVLVLRAGNGQAAAALAKRYKTVHAQDASAEQVRRRPRPRSFRVRRRHIHLVERATAYGCNTDPSVVQVAAAPTIAGVRFEVAPSEANGLPDASVDLLTVAQAMHW